MVPMKDIPRYGDAIVAAFQPRRIVLFGSYVYGTATEDSDVDVMVVIPKGRFRRDLGWRIPVDVPPRFPLDLLVEPEDRLQRRIADGESFILEVAGKGNSCMEASTAEWIKKPEADYRLAHSQPTYSPPPPRWSAGGTGRAAPRAGRGCASAVQRACPSHAALADATPA